MPVSPISTGTPLTEAPCTTVRPAAFVSPDEAGISAEVVEISDSILIVFPMVMPRRMLELSPWSPAAVGAPRDAVTAWSTVSCPGTSRYWRAN